MIYTAKLIEVDGEFRAAIYLAGRFYHEWDYRTKAEALRVIRKINLTGTLL